MLSEKKIYPLNSSEMGIYLDNKETTAYNLPYFLPLSDDIDTDRLKKAVKKLFDIRPHLFIRVCIDADGNVGKYIDRSDFDIPTVKSDGLETFEPVPFDLTKEQLFRLAIYETKDKKYLFFEFHHILMDGTSAGLFVKDLFDVYDGKPVADEECSAEEYSEKESENRRTKAYEDGKEYYRKTFGGIECSSVLPFDKTFVKKLHPASTFIKFKSLYDYSFAKHASTSNLDNPINITLSPSINCP